MQAAGAWFVCEAVVWRVERKTVREIRQYKIHLQKTGMRSTSTPYGITLTYARTKGIQGRV